MFESFSALLVGAIGGVVATAIQYFFKRRAEEEDLRREVVETYLLQLQNSVESLYYRMNNLRDWAGRAVMSDDYYEQSSAYVVGRVLAHESLLVSKGVYAKLRRNARLKRTVKAKLHEINWALDHPSFHHYVRVQLSEMLLEEDRIISYTEFVERWKDPRYVRVTAAVSAFVKSADGEALETVRSVAGNLVGDLERETSVPSALALKRGDVLANG
jgi:hypothetical protein